MFHFVKRLAHACPILEYKILLDYYIFFLGKGIDFIKLKNAKF